MKVLAYFDTFDFNVLYFLKMSPNFDVRFQIKPNCWNISMAAFIAQTYLQSHYSNGVFGNVYFSAGKH